MAYTALYREWRPRVFSDVIGQEHITTTLINEIKANRIGHAYLFSGTRGTGKTTCAKIMAKALNCIDLKHGEPCNACHMCVKIDAGMSLDVVEQDAATNNKVDDIRDLIDEVQYPPHEGKYKVYILDEVHMLSTGAVNAFLKTLEEPPEHVVFILATTDPQKLPVTILSRCQRFDFKRIKYTDIAKRL
ncbi:MAG TPA: DNA polymerase III subunit gamma/tau, partial [Bacteroidales bacterium]|nr:DNA polymerase III subunit gamma/tau [Bacteroidales bacterium]